MGSLTRSAQRKRLTFLQVELQVPPLRPVGGNLDFRTSTEEEFKAGLTDIHKLLPQPKNIAAFMKKKIKTKPGVGGVAVLD